MITIRRVHGISMDPSLSDGQIVLFLSSRNFKVGDIVIAFVDGREVVKRITKIKGHKVFLEGDNKTSSTDSRKYGWISDVHISGKIVFPFWI